MKIRGNEGKWTESIKMDNKNLFKNYYWYDKYGFNSVF